MADIEQTYRLILLDEPSTAGRTAASPDLAKLVPGDGIPVGGNRTRRLGMERTDWADHFGKPKVQRSVIVDAETSPNEWTIGP
jgi:hypothetical protein